MAKFTIDTTNLTRRALEAVGLTTKQQAAQAASRAYEAGFYDNADGNDEPGSGTLASYGYQRKTAHGLRDFSRLNNDQILNIAWILYQSNPLADRYFEIVRDHILGRGIEPGVQDDDLRVIIEKFWTRNKLDKQLKKFTVQLRLFGEQCYPAFVRESDGQVTLGYIDPADIDHVVTHPHNSLEVYAVILKMDSARRRRIYRLIRRDEGSVRDNRVTPPVWPDKLVMHNQVEIEAWEQLLLESNGISEYTGSCFYFSVNNVSNQPRGFTDLLQVADWLDADDETLFALADREQTGGYFSWIVTLDGVEQSEVDSRAAQIRQRVPKKGQALVKNDKEHWETAAPDLKQQGSIATSEALSDRAWGMLGLPKPWRGIGEDSNRASATVMGEPTRKSLESKQDDIKEMIMDFLAFARDQAEIAKAWHPADENAGEITVTMPEMTKADTVLVSDTLTKLVDALDKAQNTLKVITREKSAEAVAKVLAEIGIEYDPTEELKEVDKAEAKKKAETPPGLAPLNGVVPQNGVAPGMIAPVNGKQGAMNVNGN